MSKVPKIKPTIDFGQLEQDLSELSKTNPTMARRLRKVYFVDTLSPVGNKRAYQLFEKRHRDAGVHVHVDLNDLKALNKIHGDEAGDYAISTFGHAASKIGKKLGGKSFRYGGDEFKHHFNNLDDAKKFVTQLHQAISKTNLGLPNFKLSFSAGVGQGRDKAEEALISAKDAKKAKGMAPGMADNHIHFHEDLGKTEELAKEMWGSGSNRQRLMRSFHGWIAPNGEFHEMDPEEVHGSVIEGLAGVKDGEDDFGNRTASDQARAFGWISVGHAGDPNASGHSRFLNDPTHPATRTLARMVANLHPALQRERFLVETEAGRHNVPHALASKGVFKPPSVTAMFRSEDLVKEMHELDPVRVKEMLPFHGLVAPNGDFHQMQPNEDHYTGLYRAMKTYGEGIDPSQHEDPLFEGQRQGWVITGTAGHPTIIGYSKVLENPTHPVSKKVAEMVRNLPPDVTHIFVNPSNKVGYRVPRHLAEKGNFKKPSTTQMFRSEDLAKIGRYWNPGFKGLVSPEGKFHQMGPKDQHERFGNEAGIGDFTDNHLRQGWVGVGHLNDNWISMSPVTHDDPNHPATKQVANLIRQLHPDVDKFNIISSTGEEWEVPRHLANKGIFRKPSVTAMFRSEDLAKAEPPDPLETLNRLRTNFHRTKDYLKQAKQNFEGAPPEHKERARDQLARAMVSHAATENYFNQGVDSIAKQVPHKKPGEEYRFKNLKDLETHLHTQPFAMLSAHRTTRTPQENELHHNALLEDIRKLGYAYTPMQGRWGKSDEPSFMVHNIPQNVAASLAQKYDQMAHIQSDKGIHNEFSHNDTYKPMPGHHGHTIDQYLDDNYSEVPFEEGGKTRFRVNLEPPAKLPPAGPSGHPHGYDWHNGHTQHYGNVPVGEVTEKSESKLHPLTQKHGPAMALPQNDPIIDPGPPNWKPGRLSVTRLDSHVMVPVSMLRDKGALVDTPYRTDDPKGWSASPEHMEKLKNSMQQKGFHGRIGLNVHPDGKIEISDGTHRAYLAEKLGITYLPAEVRYRAHAESKQGLLHGPGTSDFKYQDSIPEEEFYGPRKPVEPTKSTFGTYEPSENKTTNDIMEMLGYVKKFETQPKLSDTFNQVANWFGVINPIKQSNLNFYRLAPHEKAIDDLIKQHGYTVHQYNKPEEADLANKNYNTKHLAIQNLDPSGQGGIEVAHARSYQKLHELAHALTLPEINKKYREGKRVGQMGIGITPWEAKRALEWEHQAARKQRALATQLGHPLTDEQFNQELNTNMMDATHRVLYGSHVEPSGAGFVPKATKVSLPRALKTIDEIAQLQDLDVDDYLPREDVFGKAEGLVKVVFSTMSKEYGQSPEHNVHGLISPQGEYFRIPNRGEHHLELAKRTGLNAPDSLEQGWLTIGHGGESSVQGHSKVLGNPNHPATITARRLAGQHFSSQMLLHFSDKEGYNTLPRHFAGAKSIMTHNWSRFGAHVDPNSMTAFHRSEQDLEKFQTPIEFPLLEGGKKHYNLGYVSPEPAIRSAAAASAKIKGTTPEQEVQHLKVMMNPPGLEGRTTGFVSSPTFATDKFPWSRRRISGGALRGTPAGPDTVLHENQHAIFKQIGQNYGRDVQQKLSWHLMSKLPTYHRSLLEHAIPIMTVSGNPEEHFTHLINYLNSKDRRDLFRTIMHNSFGKEKFTSNYERKFHNGMKQAHRMLRQIAATTKFNKETGGFEGGDLPKPVAKFEGVDAPAQTGKLTKPLTVQGKQLQPNLHITKPEHSQFDAKTGELHTPRGTFKVQLHDSPHKLDLMGNTAKDYFNHIITSPDVQRTHEKAMTNWKHLNGLLAQGKIPEPLVAHSALFTVLSANNAVPMQELMYSRLVDQLKDQGVDPGSVSFGQLMGKGGKLREAWKQSDKPQELPKHSRAHFEGPAATSIRQQAPSEQTGRKQGDIYKLQYMDAASDKLSHYPELHKYLTGLVKKHGTNTRAAVDKMMEDKAAGTGPAALTSGAGIGSKIGRYMYSMLGGGNSVVPDTHFIRHLFGLDSQKDTESHKYLKDLLWDPRNHHLLNGIDEHYLNNYPTVKFVQDKYFGGQKTDQALFPAFWLHWLGIAPHEKMLGIGKPQAAHNASSHRPYWEMANEILRKHGLDDPTQKAEPEDDEVPIHFRTASAMHDLETKLGPAAASMVFYAHILPHLLKA